MRVVVVLASLLALLWVVPSGVEAQWFANYTGATTSYPIPFNAACQNARGMAVDSAGSMYICCGGPSTPAVGAGFIIVMDSAGNFVRNITQSFAWSPFGIAFSGSSMYVSSLWTSTMYQLTLTGAVTNQWTTFLNNPWGVAVDSAGNVYVANYGAQPGFVLKFDPTGKWLQNFTAPDGMASPEEMAVDGSGNVWVVDTDNDRIVKFNSGGSVAATYNNTNPILNEPGGIALDSSGNVYIADTYEGAVIQLNSNGQQVQTLAGNAATQQLSQPAGLAVDSNGVVYALDSITNNRVLKFAGSVGGNSSSSSTAGAGGNPGNGNNTASATARVSLAVSIVAGVAAMLAASSL